MRTFTDILTNSTYQCFDLKPRPWQQKDKTQMRQHFRGNKGTFMTNVNRYLQTLLLHFLFSHISAQPCSCCSTKTSALKSPSMYLFQTKTFFNDLPCSPEKLHSFIHSFISGLQRGGEICIVVSLHAIGSRPSKSGCNNFNATRALSWKNRNPKTFTISLKLH